MAAKLNESAINSCYLGREVVFHTLDIQLGHSKEVDVLFVQDGVDYLELGEFQQTINQVLSNQKKENMHLQIVFIPPGTSRNRYDMYHPKGKNHKSYVEYFQKELVPFIQNRMESPIRKMGLLGDSLGAAVNISIACDTPDNWTHILLQSGAFNGVHLNKLKALQQPTGWRVYQVVGLHEQAVQYPLTGEILSILEHNRKLLTGFRSITDHVTYFEEDEKHLWDFWRRDLPRALTYFVQ